MKRFSVYIEYCLAKNHPNFKERMDFRSRTTFEVEAIDVNDVYINRLRAYTGEGSYLSIRYLTVKEAKEE